MAMIPTTAPADVVGRHPLVSGAALARLRAGALAPGPCSHLVIDDFLHPEVAARTMQEIEAFTGRWSHRRHHGQSKRVFARHSDMPETAGEIVACLNGDDFIRRVEAASGSPALIADPDLEGGGLCEMRPGDFMRPHLDSPAHVTHPRWRRVHGLFVFLNPDWNDSYGGHLNLWQPGNEADVVRIQPLFNRCVLFGDPPGVVHSVSTVDCPPGAARRSIAVYYYAEEAEAIPLQPTIYRDPETSGRPPGVTERLNQSLLWLYFALRRRLRLRR
jgi:Rps23 Pro-64 3,4-dihydroxylase Tpa1-like proline 4-hydroxylase